jgi:hypothetical protein
MSDVFREVDEDLRREQLKKVWQRYGNWIIAGAVLIVVIVGGYSVWQGIQNRQAAASGDRYNAALVTAETDLEAARTELQRLADEGAGDYPTLARMREASVLAQSGDELAAAAAFDEVAADGGADASLRDVARIRAAMLLVDTTPLNEIRQRLEPLTGAEDAFRFVAREVLALSAIRAGDLQMARTWLLATLQDPAVPQTSWERAGQLLALVDGRERPATSG